MVRRASVSGPCRRAIAPSAISTAGNPERSVGLATTLNISSFGEDEAGEIYVVGLDGTVHRLIDPAGGGCTFALSPTSRSVPAASAQGVAVGVSAPPSCGWTATSNASWITITSGESGSGNGQVVFAVDSSPSIRTGTLTIAGLTFTLTQGCPVSLGSTSRSVKVGGIQGATVGVNAAAGCGWTATSNDSWITITSGQSDSGNGQVRYSVAPNQGSGTTPRTGTLTIGGRMFRVSQAGCTYSLSSTSRSITVGGISSTNVAVSAPSGCGWTASSDVPWITILSGQSDSGNGRVRFSVASNRAGTGPRAGRLTIGGRTFTTNQAGP